MGILAADRDQDSAALEHVYGTALAAWQKYFTAQRQEPPYEVAFDRDQIVSLSDRGQALIESLFPDGEPSVCDRVAVLVVLAVNSSVISISKGGRPILDIAKRREFNTRLACGLATVAFSIFTWNSENEKGHYLLIIPQPHLVRLVEVIHLMRVQDQADLNHREKVRREQSLRNVAKDVICVYAFLFPYARPVPGPFDGDFAWPNQGVDTAQTSTLYLSSPETPPNL